MDESLRVVSLFHLLLNSSTALPKGGLRRNTAVYPLICYVNNIAGLFTSKNLQPIPLFIARSAEHMEQYPASPETEVYYDLVKRYLAQMLFHLGKFEADIQLRDGRIPDEYLNAGHQSHPRVNFGPGVD